MRIRTTAFAIGVSALALSAVAITSLTAPAEATTKRYSMTQVKTHNRATSCWTVIGSGVYNLTRWIPLHPGGAGVIRSLCGKQGTAAFTGMHSTAARPAKMLAKYRIGTLIRSGTATPSATPSAASGTFGAAMAKHNTAADCWSTVNGSVYDLTAWITKHPGGTSPISAMCGIDATAAFKGKHGLAGSEAGRLASFRLGATSDALPAGTVTPRAAAEETFTAAQVKQHTVAADCWVVINGSVYNLTQWISRHPGGQRVIVAACGLDASAAFAGERAHARATSQTMLTTFRLGGYDASAGALGTALSYDN